MDVWKCGADICPHYRTMSEDFAKKLLQLQMEQRPVLGKANNVDYWKRVILLLRKFKKVAFLPKPLKLLSNFYLDQMLKKGCSDMDLLMRIFQMYALSLNSEDGNSKAVKKTLRRILAPYDDDDNKGYRKEKSKLIKIAKKADDEKFSRALAVFGIWKKDFSPSSTPELCDPHRSNDSFSEDDEDYQRDSSYWKYLEEDLD